MFEKVRNIIATQLDIPENIITPTTKLREDLGADSLDAVEVVMSIEEEYDIVINDDAFENISTIEELCNYISKQL